MNLSNQSDLHPSNLQPEQPLHFANPSFNRHPNQFSVCSKAVLHGKPGSLFYPHRTTYPDRLCNKGLADHL